MGNVYRAFKNPQLPNNYFRIEVILLRSLGIELLHEETITYSIFSKIFLFITVIVYTLNEVYEMYAQWGNLNIILCICAYLMTHITGVIKTGILYRNRKKIGGILKAMHCEPFKPNEVRGGDLEAKLIRDVIRKTEIQLTVYFLVVSGTICSGGLDTVWRRFSRPREEWLFPYAPTMSLFDLTHSPFYELGCLYQFWGVLSYAGIIATTYVLLSAIMAHISVQLKILANAFRNLKPRALSMQQLHGQDRLLNFYIKVCIKDSIEHHLDILKLVQDMENLCSLMILVVFMASVCMLCFTLYLASMCPIGSIPFIQNFCFWWIIICQVGMYCYWGNEVTLESEKMAKVVFESDWTDFSYIAKDLIMVVQRAQRPLEITAGKFVPLSLTIFMQIVKGSFSYFTVLRQSQDIEV